MSFRNSNSGKSEVTPPVPAPAGVAPEPPPPPPAATSTPEMAAPVIATADQSKAALDKSIAAAARTNQFAQVFSQAIAVLMRDQHYRNLPLRNLETLLPPIMAGQCIVASAPLTKNGPAVPVALAIWARVSPEIDRRLSEELGKPIELKAADWTSGTIWWVVTMAGTPRALPTFIKQLREKEFAGRDVKIRVVDKDGHHIVRNFNDQALMP